MNLPQIAGRLVALCLAGCAATPQPGSQTRAATAPDRPNIILIYVDDLGYGDVGVYGASGVETPNIDAMAKDGLMFTDVHASSATCTPSRYSLLTGEYGFRSKAEILKGDAPALIRPGKPTLADMLSRQGYRTGVVGKWHLGLGDGVVDWNGEISPGPLDIGFDYAFILPATGDRVPTVYVENRHIVGLDPDDPITVNYGKPLLRERPLGFEHPELLRQPADRQHAESIINGVSRIGTMAGGHAAEWVDEDFPDVLTEAALGFIHDAGSQPFFLYYAFHDIHVPRLPNERFKGESELGVRGDAIVQMDWMTGRIVRELEEMGIADETLIIFTSDNGPVVNDGYDDGSVQKLGQHKPAGLLRGGKYSAFEAGARVPAIVYWPGQVGQGESAALLSQTDLYASIAELVGASLGPDAALDSYPLIETWLGKSETGRQILFKESAGTVTLRDGQWKYIAPVPSDREAPGYVEEKGIESGWSDAPQLYDLSADIGETRDVASEHPDQMARMQAELRAILDRDSPVRGGQDLSD